MTSLTGASGEDFASILRSLGYRMERQPKPAGAGRAPAPAGCAECGGRSRRSRAAPDARTRRRRRRPESHATPSPSRRPPLRSCRAPSRRRRRPKPAAERRPPEAVRAGRSRSHREPRERRTKATGCRRRKPPAEPAMIEVWRPGRPRASAGRVRHRRPPPCAQAAAARPRAEAAAPRRRPKRRRAAPTAAEAPSPQPRSGKTVRTRGATPRTPRAPASAESGKSGRAARPARSRPRVERGPRGPRRERGSQVERAEREQYYAKPRGRRPAATKSRIPIRRSPSSRRSRQQLEQKHGALAPRLRLGSPAHRQMAVARARGAHAAAMRPPWSKPATCGSTASASTAPSQLVRAGDVVTLALDRTVRVLQVRASANGAAAAAAARALYRDLTTRSGSQGLRLGRRSAYELRAETPLRP